jgi:hypothetical protein
LGEWGDRSQIATIALAGANVSPVSELLQSSLSPLGALAQMKEAWS